jgi:hypothetical protein
LSWISSPASGWNKLVANREACIQETTNVNDWKPVPKWAKLLIKFNE